MSKDMTKREVAKDFAARTVENLKKAVVLHGHAPFGPGSEALQARVADLYARETELLELWKEILYCVEHAP